MTDAAEPTSAPASLHAALLDYFSAPGKYQLTLRQPAILFASVREILQIASGRGSSADLPKADGEKLAEAANFFLRAALLYPGADHYAVLGLPPRTPPVELKERYRLLMRLIHPDFTPTDSAAWPADAAVRVNRAYEVLSSPVLRKEYDEQLATPHAQRSAEAAAAKVHRPVARPRREERTWHVNPKAAWAAAIAIGAFTVMLLMPSGENVDLVQKSPLPLSSPQPVAHVAPAPSAVPAGAVRLQIDSLPAASAAQAPAVPPSHLAAAHPAARPPAPVARQEAAPPARPPVPAPAAAAAAPPPPVVVARREPPPVAPVPAAVPRAPEPVAIAPLRRPEPAAMPAPATAPRPVEEPPVAANTAPPAPAAAAAPAPPQARPAPAPAPVMVAAAAQSPTLADAQPLLSQLLQILESGNGNQLLRLVEAEGRRTASAQALTYQYDQLVRGARPVRLTQVEFKGESREGVLLVTGRIRLHAGEPTIGSHGERFLVRAEFVSRGGKVLLTGLSGAAD
jgi:hypothetical protein